MEFGGEVAELGGYFVWGSGEVGGPLVVFGGVEAAGREGDERVGCGGQGCEFAEGVLGSGDGAAVVHADAALQEADRGVEALGFGVGVGDDDADGEGGFGRRAVGAGLEVGLIVLDGAAGLDGGEEVGEGVGEALLGGGYCGPHRGAEQPEVGGAGRVGRDADAGEGMVGAEEVGEALGVEEGAELG